MSSIHLLTDSSTIWSSVVEQFALALLVYPGLVFALILALAFGWLVEGRMYLGWSRAAWASLDGLTSLASVLLVALALALLPWPLHPAAGWPWIASPIALWPALEGAFLVPLLPGLLAPSPLGGRAASREAQMSIAGRCVVWLALAMALWGGAGWTLLALPGRVLIGLAGLLALPAAIGSGPFGAERSLSAAGAEEGLDEATTALVRFARTARGAALLAALIIASLPTAAGVWSPPTLAQATPVQPWVGLLLFVALFIVIVLLLRRMTGLVPRLTLPAALRWCWWRALPLAVIGMLYLILV
jgi:hypothetical protein